MNLCFVTSENYRIEIHKPECGYEAGEGSREEDRMDPLSQAVR